MYLDVTRTFTLPIVLFANFNNANNIRMRCIYHNAIGIIEETSNDALFNLQRRHHKDLAEVCTKIGDMRVLMRSSL